MYRAPKNVCTWLREISSCSCLPVLPGPASGLLSKIYIHFLGALYNFQYSIHDSKTHDMIILDDSTLTGWQFLSNFRSEVWLRLSCMQAARRIFLTRFMLPFQASLYFTQKSKLKIVFQSKCWPEGKCYWSWPQQKFNLLSSSPPPHHQPSLRE